MKIEVKTVSDFEKALIFPKEYEHSTSIREIKGNFENAKKILSPFKDGKFFVTNNSYEWFVFEIPNKVKILFYPHKTISTGNVNTRARNQSSKDKVLFEKVKSALEFAGIDSFHFKFKYK